MSEDRSYIEENARQLERLRALIDGLDEDDLRASVNEYWSVAGVLGHVAFWDARVLALADRLERGLPFTASEEEPEDPAWINDAARPLIHAIPPSEMAALALELAEQTDRSRRDAAARSYVAGGSHQSAEPPAREPPRRAPRRDTGGARTALTSALRRERGDPFLEPWHVLRIVLRPRLADPPL